AVITAAERKVTNDTLGFGQGIQIAYVLLLTVLLGKDAVEHIAHQTVVRAAVRKCSIDLSTFSN
ncbi:hypothetical protein, partial [Pseudomonas aeruginosa]|uniref:hypothetical protein n=1 Tax=Pseudomonas aeruginosa TaxID=287 RepID=UPI001ABBE857